MKIHKNYYDNSRYSCGCRPLLVMFGTLFTNIQRIVTVGSSVIGVFGKLFALLAGNPFVLIIAGIALLIGGLILAYNKVEWFRNGVNAFFQGVSDVAVEVFNFVGGFISGIFEGVWTNISNVFGSIKQIFTGFLDFVTGVFTGDWSKAWQGLVDILAEYSMESYQLPKYRLTT